MALSLIGEIHKRPAAKTLTDFTAVRNFLVRSTEPSTESGVNVLSLEDLPDILDKHPDNENLVAANFKAEPKNDTSDVWLVSVGYKPDSAGFSLVPGDENPWDLPPYNISEGTIIYNRVLEKAYKAGDAQFSPSEAVLNSAKDVFDPPVMTEEYNTILKFSYNKKYYTLGLSQEYKNTINNQPITILGIRINTKKGRINDINAVVKQIINDDGEIEDTYYQINVEVEISAKDKFRREVLDRGFYYLDDGDRKEIKLSTSGVLGDKGVSITEPAKLDGSTGALSSDAKYIEFQDSFAKNWTPLGFPKKQGG